MLTIAKNVKEKYPGLHFGVMILENVSNPQSSELLNHEKISLESKLRCEYGEVERSELRKLPILGAYHRFYKSFKKTYHVELQLLSVVKRGKAIPTVAALVETMFMTELESHVLMAVYDMDKVCGSFKVRLSTGGESFLGLGGNVRTSPKGDVVLHDCQQTLGTIICGPDNKCRITDKTTRVAYVVYGVPGVEKKVIQGHFISVFEKVRLFAEEAEINGLYIE